jgi:peroxiredoxin Q/BCP
MTSSELFPGSPAPDFSLPSHTGAQVTLSTFRGQKVVLFFVREFI